MGRERERRVGAALKLLWKEKRKLDFFVNHFH